MRRRCTEYVIPNDEEEQGRMDIQYHGLRMLFGDKPFFAPIGENLQCILDIGTGTGDLYPSARVIGTDLSPIQPPFVPPNVEFEIHNCTEFPWAYKEDSVDLIHTRVINGFAVGDWEEFYTEAFNDDDSFLPDSALLKWCHLMNEGAVKADFNLRLTADVLEKAIEKAGFIDVTVLEMKLPIRLWPADSTLKEAGKFALGAMLHGLQGISLAIFTRYFGWQAPEMEVFLAQVRSGWRLKRVHSYWPIFVVYGRKPLSTELN